MYRPRGGGGGLRGLAWLLCSVRAAVAEQHSLCINDKRWVAIGHPEAHAGRHHTHTHTRCVRAFAPFVYRQLPRSSSCACAAVSRVGSPPTQVRISIPYRFHTSSLKRSLLNASGCVKRGVEASRSSVSSTRAEDRCAGGNLPIAIINLTTLGNHWLATINYHLSQRSNVPNYVNRPFLP